MTLTPLIFGYFLVNASPDPLAVVTSNLQVHRAHDVVDTALFYRDLGLRSNQIFLVNAFPPKPLDISTSNFRGA